ncbi:MULTISPECIES: hypothetical protein [unclassified Microcoleus]|uniref:hypothetical protein n=1 Tax=unclassified Microcoleus TaxID=2642155 RepID=UPI0025F697AC|nr:MULTISPECIES: hypothetical protein [unclassified Microcoleus]
MKNTKIKDEGSSATSNVPDVTDVTDVTAVSAREEGRFSSSSNSPPLPILPLPTAIELLCCPNHRLLLLNAIFFKIL